MQRIAYGSTLGWLLFLLGSPWFVAMYDPYPSYRYEGGYYLEHLGYNFSGVMFANLPMYVVILVLTIHGLTGNRKWHISQGNFIAMHAVGLVWFGILPGHAPASVTTSVMISITLFWFITFSFWNCNRKEVPEHGKASRREVHA